MNAQLTADDKVRTSAALPGDLWERAKAAAARRRCSLQDLLEEGLRQVVERLESETGTAAGPAAHHQV